MNRRRAFACVMAISAGCGSWPRHAHLPAEVPVVPVDVDPRSLVEVSWAAVTVADLEQPPGGVIGAVGSSAPLLTGELLGIGWSDLAVPLPLADATCGSSGVRAPLTGDWVGDVDVFELTTDRAGRLCASLAAADIDTGLDLLLLPLDTCGIPVGFVDDAQQGEALGLAEVGPVVEWSVTVGAGERYALIIAGYDPIDMERVIPWTLGLSVVPADAPLCPLLPGEGR